jgi:SH3-like domain-containing protein
MRSIPVSVTILILVSGTAWAGDVGRDIRIVTADIAEVRAKQSLKPEFYVTNRLKKGTPVEVTGEEPDGWLAIKAPEGSFSYINTRFITQYDRGSAIRVVMLEGVNVPVFVGSEVVERRPTVIGTSLEPGTQVISMNAPVTDADGTWLRIRPPERERRYIRAEFVSKTPGDASAHSTFTPNGGKLQLSSAPSANLGSSPDDLNRRAREADLAGRTAEAINLYARLAADTVNSNPAFSAQAMRYAQHLRDKASVTPVSRASTTVALGAPAAPGATTAVSVPAEVPAASTFVPAPNMPAPRVGNAQWLGYRGVLRRSGYYSEGVQTYVLDDPLTLRPLIELVPARGMNLDAYLTRTIHLYGWTWYRGDLRRNFMQASQLRME